MTIKKHFTGTYGTMYYVKNVERSARFYQDKFGFKIDYVTQWWGEIQGPKGQKICLHLAEKGKKLPQGGVMIQNVVKMGELVAKLKKKGVKFVGKPHKVHADDYTVHYKDLDGNEVSIYGTL